MIVEIEKHRADYRYRCFLFRSVKLIDLFTLSSLMTRLCQQLSVLVLPHFLTTFFDDTAQLITSNLNRFYKYKVIL